MVYRVKVMGPSYGSLLKWARSAHSLSADDVAKALNASRDYYRKLETLESGERISMPIRTRLIQLYSNPIWGFEHPEKVVVSVLTQPGEIYTAVELLNGKCAEIDDRTSREVRRISAAVADVKKAVVKLESKTEREISAVTNRLQAVDQKQARQQAVISDEHRHCLSELSDKMEKLRTELNGLFKSHSTIEVSYSDTQSELAGLSQSIGSLSKAQQEVQLFLESYTRKTSEFQHSTETGLAELYEASKEVHNTLDTHRIELNKFSAALADLVERVDALTQYPNWVSNEAEWRRVVESNRPTTEYDRQQLYNLMKQANRPEKDLRQIVQYGLFSKDECGRISVELKGEWVTKLTHDTTLSFGVALGLMLPVWFSDGVPSNTALLAIFTIVSILTFVAVVFQREIVRPYFTAYLWMKGRDRRTGLCGLFDRVALVSTLASLGPRTA